MRVVHPLERRDEDLHDLRDEREDEEDDEENHLSGKFELIFFPLPRTHLRAATNPPRARLAPGHRAHGPGNFAPRQPAIRRGKLRPRPMYKPLGPGSGWLAWKESSGRASA